MDPTLPSYGFLKLLWSALLKFTLDPEVRFGSPQQRATEPWRVWWHVPVTVKRRWWSWRDSIPRCIVQVVRPDTESDKPMNMRWQHRDDPTGRSEVMLESGRLKLVPIALRDEESAGPSRVRPQMTGESFLRDKQQKFAIRPGQRWRFRMRVRSGAKQWTSAHIYKVAGIEDDASNGHFALEIETQDPY